MRPPHVLRDFAFAVLTGVLATLAAVLALGVTPQSLGQRWLTGGPDQVLHYGIFASAREVFPFFPNASLGFPEAQNLFFAPLFDPGSALFVWLLTPVLPDGVWALNVYNLAGFAAVGFTSYLFLRALRLRRLTAVVFGLAFALAPYHFLQMGMGHPFLANYWTVPLIGILLLMVAGDRTNPLMPWIAAARTRGRVLAWRIVPIVVLTLMVAWAQSYYFVFGAILVGLAAATNAVLTLIRREGFRSLLWPAVTLGSLVVFIAVELGVLSLNWGERYSQYFGARTLADSEKYGGKLVELLLPASTSGFNKLAVAARFYRENTGASPDAEPPGTALLGSLALIVLLLVIVLRVTQTSGLTRRSRLGEFLFDPRTGVLAGAFVWAFLFYTLSGLGAVLALVRPEIRAWGRMSVVLMMLALAVAALLIEAIITRRWLRYVVLAALAVVAAVDQLGGLSRAVPLMPENDTALRQFAHDVDTALPAECGIAILPLHGFPEAGNSHRMGDYDQALPYVYEGQADLRWSYGAVNGTRSAEYWTAANDPTTFAAAFRASGACAIVVDTFGYSADAEWKPWVAAVTDTEPEAVSSDAGSRYQLFVR